VRNKFEIIKDTEIICLQNKEMGDIIGKHKPFGNKFVQYKRISPNCNIIREDEKDFPINENGSKANIYCLDDKCNIKWIVKMPISHDCFPNPIIWGKKAIEIKKQDGLYTLVVQDNPNTFICSSLRGFTVTVDCQTGQTVNTEFAK